jgi:hypothetical protein
MPTEQVFEFGYCRGRQVKHFLIDVTALGRAHLERALAIAFTNYHDELEATHVAVDGKRQLIFLRGVPRTQPAGVVQELPLPMKWPQAAAFAWQWLSQADYGADEHDGATRQGWRVFNERFGIVAGCWEAIVAVRPMFIYIPK